MSSPPPPITTDFPWDRFGGFRSLLGLLLLISLYFVLIVIKVRDIDFLADNDLALPLIGVGAPTRNTFLIGAIVYTATHVFVLYALRLWRDASFPPTEHVGSPIAGVIFGSPSRHADPVLRIGSLLAELFWWALLVAVPLFLLLLAQVWSLKLQSEWRWGVQYGLIVVDLAAILWLWPLPQRLGERPQRPIARRLQFVFLGMCFAFATVDAVPIGSRFDNWFRPISLGEAFEADRDGRLVQRSKRLRAHSRITLTDVIHRRFIWIGNVSRGTDIEGVNYPPPACGAGNSCVSPAFVAAARLSEDIHERGKLGASLNVGARNLRLLTLQGASFPYANLYGATMDGAFIFRSNLFGAELTEAKLRKAWARKSDLRAANLTKADLTDANLEKVELGGAELHHAVLIGAKLRKADARLASFLGANLSFADLERAQLSGATFSCALALGARFEEAALNDADIRGAALIASPLSRLQLDSVRREAAQVSFAPLLQAAQPIHAKSAKAVEDAAMTLYGPCIDRSPEEDGETYEQLFHFAPEILLSRTAEIASLAPTHHACNQLIETGGGPSDIDLILNCLKTIVASADNAAVAATSETITDDHMRHTTRRLARLVCSTPEIGEGLSRRYSAIDRYSRWMLLGGGGKAVAESDKCPRVVEAETFLCALAVAKCADDSLFKDTPLIEFVPLLARRDLQIDIHDLALRGRSDCGRPPSPGFVRCELPDQ